MVDDVRDISETAESKAQAEALDRARLARERREAEQRKRLDELRAHAAAAQAQREKRDEDRRKRQAEQRAKDDERRVLVEERKRAIWEASVSRREALLQRERDRTERLDRQRAARSAPRPAFAFGSSTPRLLEPVDSAGFFWAARSYNPIDQMNFFESLAASTTNVMFASAPLTRRASALHLDASDDNKDEPERAPAPAPWSSVARRRTDLVPTVPAPRAPETRSGDTTPGSRPGSALSNATGVVRRPASGPRKPRPASIAGTGVNTPRGGVGGGGGGDSVPPCQSAATTPSVSRDSSMAGGDVPRRAHTTPRRPRPASHHASADTAPPSAPGEGKPPLHRKPKPSKEHNKTPRGKSQSVSPGRARSPAAAPAPGACRPPADHLLHDKPLPPDAATAAVGGVHINAVEVTQKLEALQIHNGDQDTQYNILIHDKTNENKETLEIKHETKIEQISTVVINEDAKEKSIDMQKSIDTHKSIDMQKPAEVQKPVEIQKSIEKREEKEEKREEKKEPSIEKTDDSDMTASMSRRITTEEQAKAALAERRRRAREDLERRAELERQRLQREAEEEEERQRLEEERQRREEDEARELARLQRRMDDEKLRKAIEAQQQLERDEAERKVREEAERQARAREDEEKRQAAEEAEKLRRGEAEREERERLARKQRVEAIMARTRLRKAEEDKKAQTTPAPAPAPAAESAPAPADSAPAPAPADPAPAPAPAPPADNGNAVQVADLLDFSTSQTVETEVGVVASPPSEPEAAPAPTNGNAPAASPALSRASDTEDKPAEQTTTEQNLPTNDNAPTTNAPTSEANNGNVTQPANIGHISANFIQTERLSNENQTKMADVPKLLEDDFATHNGHGATHNHPLTLQNAI